MIWSSNIIPRVEPIWLFLFSNFTHNSGLYRDILEQNIDKLKNYNIRMALNSIINDIGIPKSDIMHAWKYSSSRLLPFKHDEKMISCFSEKKDNILMWAHYGNHLGGLCLIYDTRLDKQLFSNLYKVEYTYERKKSDSPEFFYSKSRDWKYEKEWRLIIDENDSRFDNDFIHTDACVGCIMGEKYDDDSMREAIAILCQERAMKCYMAITDDKEYRIIICKH